MPKVKIPRKSTTIDMTAMCDVAFLLLTFFMLATKFKSEEPVTVVTPSSVNETPIADADIMLVTIDKDGRVFFSIDNPKYRKELIEKVNTEKNLGLTSDNIIAYANGSSIGEPMNMMKSYLSTPHEELASIVQPGIPVDTVFSNPDNVNELTYWIMTSRTVNPGLRIAINADQDAHYPSVEKVLKTFENLKIHKFNMITSLEAVPSGTVLYEESHSNASKH